MIVVEQISGFVCSDPVIRVYEKGNVNFYQFNNEELRPVCFNLPKGIYASANNLKKLPRPVKYKLPRLPRAEEKTKVPDNIHIVFANNPNKCSIFLDQGRIVLDYQFQIYPSFILKYILTHEIGHYLYKGNGEKSEMKCDDFAAYHMLKRGYNPSQIKLANNITLNSGLRKQNCHNYLLKSKNK